MRKYMTGILILIVAMILLGNKSKNMVYWTFLLKRNFNHMTRKMFKLGNT